MRRLLVITLVLFFALISYGLVYAEDAPGVEKDIELLPNMDFESVVEAPDITKTAPAEGFDPTLGIAIPDQTFFPFGWQKFLSSPAEPDPNILKNDVKYVVVGNEASKKNGLLVTTENPKALHSTMAFVTFPASETMTALAGRKIRLSAMVYSLIPTAPPKEGEAPVPPDIRILSQGKDFTGEFEMKEFINFAGVNILFVKHATVEDEKEVKGKTVVASEKSRKVAFSNTLGFVELYCEVVVPPDCDTAIIMLECKGVAKAVFTDVNIDVNEDRANKIVPPLNLDMSAIGCKSAYQPRDWYKLITNDNAYASQSAQEFKSGQHSLEISNPDPLNTNENIVFASNFDIMANNSLWGREVKFSASVKTDMVPGITPDSSFFDGDLTLEKGKDYNSAADLVAWRNYASANIYCRNSRGKDLVPDKLVRKFVFGKSNGWTTIETTIIIPPRTYSIEWGLMLVGRGRAWFDNIKLETGTDFALTNTGFEERFEGAPVGWRKDSVSVSSLVVTDPENNSQEGLGQRSLCLVSPRNIELNAMFAIQENIPAGHKLIWEADVKTDIDRNHYQQNAYLQIEVDADKFVENAAIDGWPMSTSLSGKTGWTRLKAVLIVDELVDAIYFKLHMKGVGKVYFDNMTLKTTRLAFPTTSIKNHKFNFDKKVKVFTNWEITGAVPDKKADVLVFRGPYAYGYVKADGVRFYQDLFEPQEKAEEKSKKGRGAEVIKNFHLKPIRLTANIKVEKPGSVVVGFEFLDSAKGVISSIESPTSLAGVESRDFLFAPYSSVEVSTVIPASTVKIRAFVKFLKSGDEVVRFHIRSLSLSGDAPPVNDSIVLMEGSVSEYLSVYGIEIVTDKTVPPAALVNGTFSSTDKRKPTSFRGFGLFKSLKLYTISPKEEMKNYSVFTVGADPLRVAQKIDFPAAIRDKMVGKNFKFLIEGFAANGATGQVGIEFLDGTGNILGPAKIAQLDTVSDEALKEMPFYEVEKSSVSAEIPAGAESAVVFIAASGAGSLFLSKAGMGYVYVASGFFDWLAYTMIFDFAKLNVLFGVLILGFLIIYFIYAARRKDLFIRKIPGLDSVDEAVGRATEMGKPILFVPGLDDIQTLATIAALNILGRVAKKVAEYDTPIIVPNRDAIVMTIAQETVKSAFLDAGRPDAYREDSVYFITEAQFAFVSAVAGTMVREKPAANFFMGGYYAESLILAETGAMTGAIQVAGTDSVHQLPFFIVACDYTLMGEELYAASAYLSREPMQMGSLKGSDYSKVAFFAAIIFGTIAASLNWPSLRWILDLMKVQ